MTHFCWRPAALTVLLALFAPLARAQVAPTASPELLPAPRCCSEKTKACCPPCCTECPNCCAESGCCPVAGAKAAASGTGCQPGGCGAPCCPPRQAVAPVDVQFKVVRDLAFPLPQPAPMFWVQVVKGPKPADVLTLKTGNGKLKIRLFNVGDLVCHTAQEAHDAGLLKKDACEEVLIKLIMHVIAPQSWSPLGGAGTIDFFPLGKTLVVNQTPEVQEQIAELLAGLRRFKLQQVAMVPPMPPPTLWPTMPPVAPNPIPGEVFTVPAMPPAPPYYSVQTPMPAPPVTYACPTLPPPCVAAVPSAPSVSRDCIKVVMEDGKARLLLTCDADSYASCEALTWKVHGHAVKIATQGKQVYLSSGAFEARADRLIDLQPDAPLVLEGNVHCRFKVQQQAGQEVVADHVSIWLTDKDVEYRVRCFKDATSVKDTAKSTGDAVKPASHKR